VIHARRLESRVGVAAGVLLILFLAFSVPALRSPASVGASSRQAVHARAAVSAQRSLPQPAHPATPTPATPAGVFATDWLATHPSPDLGIQGQGVILVDVDKHEVRWQRDASTLRAPASLTKIVTAMVAVDLVPLDHPVTVGPNTDMKAVQKVEPASTLMGLSPGEVLTVHELLYGLFLRSGNDAAETLGSGIVPRDQFVALMNQKAAELGMKNSHFTTPVGLDDPAMRTTPYDLAIAAAAVVSRYPELLAISGTPQITIPQTPTHKAFAMENYNKLLLPGPWAYPGATGMKTAFTDDAGPCMVATAARGNRRLVAVILHSDNFFGDATKLLNYGFGLPS
jgi:D-alanyl-D-alanine carboxypeptidase (penicillin-binding protein 5/6)